MAIELELGKLLENKEALENLANTELKFSDALNISKIIKSSHEALDTFEKERVKLVKKYSSSEEGSNEIRVSSENLEVFNKEIQEMVNTKVSINGEKINSKNLENVKLTARDIILLSDLILE